MSSSIQFQTTLNAVSHPRLAPTPPAGCFRGNSVVFGCKHAGEVLDAGHRTLTPWLGTFHIHHQLVFFHFRPHSPIILWTKNPVSFTSTPELLNQSSYQAFLSSLLSITHPTLISLLSASARPLKLSLSESFNSVASFSLVKDMEWVLYSSSSLYTSPETTSSSHPVYALYANTVAVMKPRELEVRHISISKKHKTIHIPYYPKRY